MTGNKGFGLFTKQKLSPGTFIMEYCGEVIDLQMLEERIMEYDG